MCMAAHPGAATPERQSWQKNGKANGAICVVARTAGH